MVCLQLGVDGIRADSMSHVMRYVMRAMPFVMLPFIMNFPTVSAANISVQQSVLEHVTM